MPNLKTSIGALAGVGPKIEEKLNKLGIENIRDLIFYYPRDWDDFSHPVSIKSLRIGDSVIIKAKIESVKQNRTHKRFMSLVEAELVDDTGQIKATWFNQPYLASILKTGDIWLFQGKVNWDFKAKCKTLTPSQMENPLIQESMILPVYSETAGLNSKFIRKINKSIINKLEEITIDYLPHEILKEYSLIGLVEALKNIHYPKNINDIEKAKRRLGFDELFFVALRMLEVKKELSLELAPQMKIDESLLKSFVEKLPYKLTNAQRKCAWDIIKDLNSKIPMNRLLEGDVGSGKTVVAAMATLVCSNNHYQTAWLAPTEILANQHFQTMKNLFENFNIKVGLLTSANKKANLEGDDLIIGTHAVIQKDVHVPNLGLIIIDEQHRFGVAQRAYLRNQNRTCTPEVQVGVNDFIPHLLSMTATPIPRTLALALYGDLEISILDEMPIGREKVETQVVEDKNRQKTYDFIELEIKKGRQAFVVCPLIEEKVNSEDDKLLNLFENDRKSVLSEYEKLSKKIFPKLNIGLLHGKMKSSEKSLVMQDFTSGKIHILVSTAVVEVGIDIPNATVMMIENADRFGLAQLHQFRGRVGRGKDKSYCFLFSNNSSENRRLKAMVDCYDGFDLAERDLEIRGPGEFVGIRQSGVADFKMASLTNYEMIKDVKTVAEKIIQNGLAKYPLLVEKLKEMEGEKHLE